MSGVVINAEVPVTPIILGPPSHGTSICLNSAFRQHVLGYVLATSQNLGDSVLNNEVMELAKHALAEQRLPLMLSSTCPLLIPIALAQHALKNAVPATDSLKYQPLRKDHLGVAEALLLHHVEKRRNGTGVSRAKRGEHFLWTLTAALTRTIPVLHSTGERMSKLLAYLEIVYYKIEDPGQLYLCGSSRRIQHNFKSNENTPPWGKYSTATPCTRVKNALYDQGLADHNFDTVLSHFVLDAWTVSVLSNKTNSMIISAENNTLNVLVSGDGKIPNGGDLFGPVVARHILDQREQQYISVKIANQNTSRAHIACVGSILQWAIDKPNLMHWGTGIISDMKVKPLSQKNSSILAVRGPRTRDLLLEQHGLNPLVIRDPALLAGDIYSNIVATTPKTISVCFVIHGVDLASAKQRCPFCVHRRVNNYNRNVTQIFTDLAPCKRVVSSSLHGIIFAHAIGIPALPVVLGDRITGGDFKFKDYMHSIGVTSFQTRTPVWEHMSNLTEQGWIEIVDLAEQPVFPVQTSQFYATFPALDNRIPIR